MALRPVPLLRPTHAVLARFLTRPGEPLRARGVTVGELVHPLESHCEAAFCCRERAFSRRQVVQGSMPHRVADFKVGSVGQAQESVAMG